MAQEDSKQRLPNPGPWSIRPPKSETALKLARLPSGKPEIFASIQCERASAGRPSAFVRLSLCNLACTWYDTKYTWDWERYNPDAEIARTECADIVARVTELGLENVVITGGEPLRQQALLLDLAASARASRASRKPGLALR